MWCTKISARQRPGRAGRAPSRNTTVRCANSGPPSSPAIHKAQGNYMTVRQRRTPRPLDQDREPHPSNLLPLRWVVIMALSATVGVMVGTAEGLPAGILASLITAGGLHKIMN